MTSSGPTDKRTAKTPKKQEKPIKTFISSSVSTLTGLYIPSSYNLYFFFFRLVASHFPPPHFLHSPVSASLCSLCSRLGVADDRRLGGSTLRHCSNTASLIFCFDAVANLQLSPWHTLAQTHARCEHMRACIHANVYEGRMQRDLGCGARSKSKHRILKVDIWKI